MEWVGMGNGGGRRAAGMDANILEREETLAWRAWNLQIRDEGGEGMQEKDRSAAVYLFSADAIKTGTSRFFTYGTL